MTCFHCQRANLPGGVRCIYCGTPFALPAGVAPPAYYLAAGLPDDTPANKTAGTSGGKKAGFIGSLSSLAILLFKAKTLFALFSLGKIALTLGTMLLSMAAYSRIYGWKLAVGFVLTILVHEMGHVVVNWRKGIEQSAPMFIPFVGAMIAIKQFPYDDPAGEADSGAGGPVAGAAAAFVCLALAHATGSPYWYTLAFIAFSMNLFNLIPVWQLDGAHMAAAFSPRLWSGVLLFLLLYALKVPTLALWLLIPVGFIARLGQADGGRHLLATPAARARVAATYVLLAISLSWGADHTLHSAALLRGGSGGRQTTTAAAAPAPDFFAPVSDDRSPLRVWTAPAPAPLVAGGSLVVVAALLWLGTASLLAKTANRPLDAGDARFVGGPTVLFALLWAVLCLLQPGMREGSAAVGAFFVGTMAAFLYAAYARTRFSSRRTIPPSSAFLTARALGWAAAGALLVDWRTNSAYVLVPLVFAAAVYYGRHPWQITAVAAGIAESLGSDGERAATLLDRAAARATDGEGAADLWQRSAVLFLSLDRGGPALDALDRREAALAGHPPPVPLAYAEAVGLRAHALMLLGRWDDCLACCEEILRVASLLGDGQIGAVLNWTVHARIARLAQFRGWNDEASAQAGWCFAHAAPTAKTLRSRLHLLQAEALANLPLEGTNEQARRAAEVARTANGERGVQAGAATALTQVALRDNDPVLAVRESDRALRLIPGHLACRYWHGRALAASGEGEGTTALQALVAAFPAEYWGLRAAAAVSPAG